VKLFVWTQVISGRFQEVYNMYFGPGEAPSLNVSGVEY
jgi:polar amino acid transport system substrate-binding protein